MVKKRNKKLKQNADIPDMMMHLQPIGLVMLMFPLLPNWPGQVILSSRTGNGACKRNKSLGWPSNNLNNNYEQGLMLIIGSYVIVL